MPPIPVTVLINPSSTAAPTAGSGYILSCVALKSASGITQSAQTQWRGPSGSAVTTNGSTVLSSAVSGPLRTVQNITFRSVSTSDAGVYTCQAILFSSALTIPFLTTQSYTIRITGEQLYIHFLRLQSST